MLLLLYCPLDVFLANAEQPNRPNKIQNNNNNKRERLKKKWNKDQRVIVRQKIFTLRLIYGPILIYIRRVIYINPVILSSIICLRWLYSLWRCMVIKWRTRLLTCFFFMLLLLMTFCFCTICSGDNIACSVCQLLRDSESFLLLSNWNLKCWRLCQLIYRTYPYQI